MGATSTSFRPVLASVLASQDGDGAVRERRRAPGDDGADAAAPTGDPGDPGDPGDVAAAGSGKFTVYHRGPAERFSSAARERLPAPHTLAGTPPATGRHNGAVDFGKSDGPAARGRTRQLLNMGPHAGAHRVAARAGLSILVPLVILWAIGRQEWSIYAAFGAFTSLYGRNHVHLSRLQMQLTLAAALTFSVGAGTLVGLSEQRSWLAVPLAGLLCGAGAWLSDAMDWHPPGALFLIFAFAACASIPSEPADVLTALVVVALSAAFAVLVGSASVLWRNRRQPQLAVRTTFRLLDTTRPQRRHVVRGFVSVVLAGTLATASGIGHPYWAMIAAIVPLVPRDFPTQLVRGVHRLVGTLAGLLVAGGLLALDLGPLALIVVITLLQVGAELLVGRNYGLALLAITPLALLMVHMVAQVPTGTLLFDRGVETVIGVLIGVAVGYLTRRPDPARP